MTAFICTVPLLSALFTVCAPPPPFATGYVEGEYVLIAPVATAQIEALNVARGDRVEAGAVLAEMERRDAEIALAEARAALAQAESQLANLREGRRPEEIRVIEATLASARAQEEEADRAADRLRNLAQRGAATATQADDAATAATVARARVAEAEANLAVARLPARPQEIAAAEAAVKGATAARARAEWNLSKRRLIAPAAGTVFDVIRTPGELAGPSAPVLSMLPDGAVKLRLYVPEAQIAAISQGSTLAVNCDGCAPGLSANVTFISDAPEFTPPVIYSLENRQKLVYLIEATPEDAPGLKPGQIVDVRLPGAEG
ncbi:HlyD family efflux transporter periplasmic adaptor subunit [Defluviimonas sp. WL0024]|uniref:HlyD family efflux transporter periplasmic adaptor subunit n=1 Tax=Albidovulum salinarum TaxID=2984153 RepID=A0ABT2X2V3_9RHOB|nr:HlyD family efflux transporter periplasmic adaptor subunit [Defluviimonas sp. WL0024]MCU9848276.1 HlyD family efflux transporter periplasmic adaptor subunit [Defluviimonas sp. WL0024]